MLYSKCKKFVKNSYQEWGIYMKNKRSKKQFDKINIGKILKNTRKSLGMTQETVSEAVELAPRYISDIERDKSKGSIDTLVKLCNLYQVTPTFILQNYLTAPESRADNLIQGFSTLSPEEKDFIINLIDFINQEKKKQEQRKKQQQNKKSNSKK